MIEPPKHPRDPSFLYPLAIPSFPILLWFPASPRPPGMLVQSVFQTSFQPALRTDAGPPITTSSAYLPLFFAVLGIHSCWPLIFPY